MEQATALRASDGDVPVFEMRDRKLRQHSVAVVSLGVDRVAAISVLRPDAVGQELVVWRRRVVGVAVGVPGVAARHLLQEHYIGANGAYGFTQLMQHEFAIEGGKALVDVDRQHLDRKHPVLGLIFTGSRT